MLFYDVIHWNDIRMSYGEITCSLIHTLRTAISLARSAPTNFPSKLFCILSSRYRRLLVFLHIQEWWYLCGFIILSLTNISKQVQLNKYLPFGSKNVYTCNYFTRLGIFWKSTANHCEHKKRREFILLIASYIAEVWSSQIKHTMIICNNMSRIIPHYTRTISFRDLKWMRSFIETRVSHTFTNINNMSFKRYLQKIPTRIEQRIIKFLSSTLILALIKLLDGEERIMNMFLGLLRDINQLKKILLGLNLEHENAYSLPPRHQLH
jgi:hypothetical protein